jgi:hypothetical protein
MPYVCILCGGPRPCILCVVALYKRTTSTLVTGRGNTTVSRSAMCDRMDWTVNSPLQPSLRPRDLVRQMCNRKQGRRRNEIMELAIHTYILVCKIEGVRLKCEYETST